MPIPASVTATWCGDQRFTIQGLTGATTTIDVANVAGTGPVLTLLGALASCAAVDVIEILAKRRTPVESLAVAVTAKRRDAAPKRLLRAHMEFRITGAGIDAPHAERAIALSIEKYCSVASSLASDMAITSALVLGGAEHPVRQHEIERPGT